MLSTLSQGNLLVLIDHKFEHTLRGLRVMGDNLNNHNNPNDVEDRVELYPTPIPHVPMLNFVKLN